jgi:beta-phosphoglucomutase-like phosphatase (HAD superfamily)
MKPHPHILLRTLRDLAVPSETAVMVGDSLTDIEAGIAADVWTIGYANKPTKDEALRELGADVIVYNLTELAQATGRSSTS